MVEKILSETADSCTRSESQKWELMEVCLINLQIWLESMGPDAAASTIEGQQVPSLSVLLDLLGRACPALPPSCTADVHRLSMHSHV